jgi:S-adenosylmethionine:tRNA ribosyltransferase-isomerase
MHPKELRIEDFSYHLPEDRIAQFPKEERDSSKLLVYENGTLQQDIYKNIADYLPADALMVFNQTKVVQVRLLFQKSTGAKIEIFCLEPDTRYADMQTAMTQKGEVYWQCLIGGANKWKNGDVVFLQDPQLNITINAQLIEKQEGIFIVHLSWGNLEISFAEVLHSVGKVPLPPYMHRETQESDKDRYQTIYAREEGSVAAPTAGLHFTPFIFEQLSHKSIQQGFLTLHVGAGTFKQVKSERIGEHEMHAEWVEFSIDFLQQLHQKLGSIIAVGTTSMRSLESLYWMGLKLYHKQNIQWDGIAISQWDAYEMQPDIDPSVAIETLINWMRTNDKTKLVTRTQIMIAPTYKAKIVDMLITNFHQPNSTLLLLIAALIGDNWKSMYDFALANDYRFLSYGDGCLLKFKE